MSTRSSDESGVALITALLAVIIVGAVAVVVTQTALTNVRATGAARDHQDALHNAEAGADLVVAQMNQNRDWNTGHDVDEVDINDPDAMRDWAIEEALDAYDLVEDGDEPGPSASWEDGEFGIGLRPQVDDEPIDEIYGVGIREGRGRQIRVVEYELTDLPFTPGAAILTNGDLSIGNNGDISGVAGSVHSNANLFLENNITIEGTATASGDECVANNGVEIGPDGNGPCQANTERRTIPDIRAHDFYELRHDHPDEWYDLCPTDGTVREPAADGAEPCSGTTTSDTQDWSFKNGTWDLANNATPEGVFYVDGADVEIANNVSMSEATLLVAGEQTGDGSCDNRSSGNVEIKNNITIDPLLENLSIVADGDVLLKNNLGGNGSVIAGEQVEVKNNAKSGSGGGGGVIIARDCNLQSLYSSDLVKTNALKNNLELSYDGETVIEGVPDGLRVSSWTEL